LDGRHFGELFDFWGGLNDIKGRIIRVLHSLSFIDDPTRMLRAVRFEQRFDFRIEDRTLHLMQEAKDLLGGISGDRIRHEIDLILDEGKYIEIISRLEELGLLNAIHPSLPWNNSIREELIKNCGINLPKTWGVSINAQTPFDRRILMYLFWLSHLPENVVSPVCKRLKLSASLHKNIKSVQKIISIIPRMKDALPSKVVSELEGISTIALFVASSKLDSNGREILEKYSKEWNKITPITNGDDLKARGLPPGQVYQKILQRLRTAWLDGEIKYPEEEKALLDKLIKDVQ
jgi:tRNA nucleotidyltransferase (CCA-adding enzyme)